MKTFYKKQAHLAIHYFLAILILLSPKLLAQNLSEYIDLLSNVDPLIFEQFLCDRPDIIYIYDLKIPPTIEIIHENEDNAKILSKKEYFPGDVIYENQTLSFFDHQTILVRYNQKLMQIDNIRHTVNRGEFRREFYYFDSFMNHSCDPNTITFYIEPNYYQTKALRHIMPGEELTCDYTVFDTAPDGEGFKCECGAKNCRGWMY